MPRVKRTAEEEWRRSVKGFIENRLVIVGLTNEQMAKRCLMQPSTLSKKKKNPETISFGEARAFAKVLECKPEDILCGGIVERKG